MFAFQSKNDMVRVGERNVEATKRKLAQLRIPVVSMIRGGISLRFLALNARTSASRFSLAFFSSGLSTPGWFSIQIEEADMEEGEVIEKELNSESIVKDE